MGPIARIKDYKSSSRYLIIYLLHGTGILTKKSLAILPSALYAHRTLRDKLHELVNEGIVAKHSTKTLPHITVYSLNEYEAHRATIACHVPPESVAYYTESHKANIRRVWNSKDEYPWRYIGESDIRVLMYAAGISSMPDQLNGDSKYYSSRELKYATDYGDDVVEDKGIKKVQFSKAFGMLTACDRYYIVYNMAGHRLPRLSKGEAKLKNHFGRLFKVDASTLPSILVANNLLDIVPYILDSTPHSESLYNNYLANYKTAYCIPYDDNGRDMLSLMCTPDWDKWIIKAATGDIQDTSSIGFACDYYDYDTKVATYVFCVPDMIKFKRFVRHVYQENDREHYRIICFDYQKELVNEIIKGHAKVLSTSFRAYYEKESINDK